MEKCCYSIFNDYDLINMGEYTRVYVGEEFCDNSFIYDIRKIEKVIQTYIGWKEISIVLPVINECSFNKVEEWLEGIKKKYDNSFEIVCNDIGSFVYYSKRGYNEVVGRLLARVIMHYLTSKEEESALQTRVTRIELDATNIKKMHHLRGYKRSYYNLYSIYGHANNRCAYRHNGIACKMECKKQNIVLHNTYLDDTYHIVKNTILHKEKNVNGGILFDRMIDVFE